MLPTPQSWWLQGISRNALVVVSGIVLFHETVSRVQAVGYFISLSFFVLYNYLQLREAGQCS